MPETSSSRDEAAVLAAKVYALVATCPPGRVTTYGWLSKAIGYERSARMVGWIMNATPRALKLPAQRVINSKGELTGSWAFGQKDRMRQLLEAEGIVFSAEGRVDLKRYGWDPSRDLDPEELTRILGSAHMESDDVSDYLMRMLQDDPASPLRITRAE
jgi:methylated-DNA-protein-cysteine methyltransferase related protein